MNTVKNIYKYMRTRIFTFLIDRYENWPKYPNTFRAEIGEWLWQKFDYETKYMLQHRFGELMEIAKHMGDFTERMCDSIEKYQVLAEEKTKIIEKLVDDNNEKTVKLIELRDVLVELRAALSKNIEDSPNGEVGYWKDPVGNIAPTQIIVEPDIVKTPLQWEQLEFDFKGWTPTNNV